MTDTALPLQGEDTPRSAYGVLERRATLVTVAVLVALAAVSWWSTVGQARDMTSMVQGFAHVGTAMPFDMSIGVFIGMWVAMMVAMMFPTIAPIVLLHRMVLRRRGGGLLPTVAFGSGYLLIWTAVGFVPLAVLVGFRHASSGSTWVLRAGGLVLVIAGLYQFTAWKETCLRACRTPLTFLMTHEFGSGPVGSARVGLSHGLYCLGCCWALMAVLFVVGLMNLTWMALIAVVFLAEKNWRHGVGLTKVVGVCLVAFGTVVLVHPALLDSITPLARGTTNMMTQ
jgi:predicted metal-binding membrane protein